MFTSRFFALTGLFALSAASPFLPRASADVVTSYYHASDNFGFEMIHMPDIDQRRVQQNGSIGLPDGGNAYCVPTASINMVLYAANHGFPGLGLGPGNYQSQANYNAVSNELNQLGMTMGTTPTGGTNADGWVAGLQAEFPAGQFVVSNYFVSGNYAPSLREMTQAAQGGSLVSFGFGRYDVLAEISGAEIIDRDGGHAITFTKSVRSGSLRVVWVRDPASPNDGVTTTQSQFKNDLMVVTPRTVFAFGNFLTMSALNYNPNANRHAFIDQYVAIRPVGSYGWQNFHDQVTVQFAEPFSIKDPTQSNLQEFEIDGNFVDMVIEPSHAGFVAVTDDPLPMLQFIDLGTQEVSHEIPAPQGTEAMVFGRHRDLYLVSDDEIYCLDVTKPDPILATSALPWDPDAMTYNDATDEVAVISFEASQLALYEKDLGGTPTILPLTGLPSLGGSEGSLAVSPVNGAYWFTASGDDAAYSIVTGPQGAPQVTRWVGSELVNPMAVNINDAGQLFFSVETTDAMGNTDYELVAMEPDGSVIGQFFVLQASATNDFAEFNLGPKTGMLCSRTNYEPDVHVGPTWSHLPPAELDFADPIYADFCNGDGGDLAGCTDCPCGNNAPQGSIGGCLNTSGDSAELIAFGAPSVSNDELRFEVREANPDTFGVLISGAARAPANASNPCFGMDSGITSSSFNGLRCVVQGFRRHGTRATDHRGAIGATNSGWGGQDAPPQGILAQGGFAAGQRRHFQVIYREDPTESCTANLNTTQAVTAIILP